MSNNTKPQQYKIIVIGAGGVGKTSYVRRLLEYTFETGYKPTVGSQVQVFRVPTNIGTIHINIWDCAGQEQYLGYKDPQYKNANGCIVMADHRVETQAKVNTKIKEAFKILGDVPITIVVNKIDLIYPDTIYPGIFYTSVKDNINMREPLLDILRKITGDSSLIFI
jgi:GTP-binding nuclear protein Ran